jgi:hypothetical protein
MLRRLFFYSGDKKEGRQGWRWNRRRLAYRQRIAITKAIRRRPRDPGAKFPHRKFGPSASNIRSGEVLTNGSLVPAEARGGSALFT